MLGSGVASGAGPRGYLSWHAPYGAPGASDTLMAPPGDGSRRDTLYLTFETGRVSPGFSGMDVILLFRAAAVDTIGPHWWFDINGETLEMQFTPGRIRGAALPWSNPFSMTSNFFERTKASARIRLSNVRPISMIVPVRDSVQYFFARVLIPRPRADVPRHDQPICIEWASGDLLLDSVMTVTHMSTTEGHRFVSWNSNGRVCEDFRSDTTATPPKAVAPSKTAKRKKGRTR